MTGGAGFIGSHLCDALLQQGLGVICLDNLLTGNENNLKDAKSHLGFKFVNVDVSQDLPEEAESANYIFHLASAASVPDYQKYPLETALVNSTGSKLLLDLARNTKARFLFASTSEIYGSPQVHPQTEDYWGNVNPNGLRACYDESKRFGEMLTKVYAREFGIDGRIMRIFNTYGPRMRVDDGRVVSNFINQALRGTPITIYGTGQQTRSFSYIDDLVEGVMRYMFTDNLSGEVINLGNPDEIKAIDLAEIIKQKTGSNSQIVFKPLPEDDPEKRRPNITKAIKLLKWQPQVSLDEGLEQTIAYYRSLAI